MGAGRAAIGSIRWARGVLVGLPRNTRTNLGRAELLAALALTGCANEGHYRVEWTIGGLAPETGCPTSGLDLVVVDWIDGNPGTCAGTVAESTDHACTDGAATGLMEAGEYTVCASAFSPEGRLYAGYVAAPDVPVG